MRTILTILIVIVAFVVLFYVFIDGNKPALPIDGTGSNSETFISSEYSFSLDYPKDWSTFSEIAGIAPSYNFYPTTEDEGAISEPLIHHDNKTNVSIFPRGIPTEGVFGQTVSVKESGIDFQYELSDDSRIYVLETGEPFAAYLKPRNNPKNWEDAGFVWARAEIINASMRCERDGEEITQEECDPLTRDDSIIWNGSVDALDWIAVSEVLESVKFTSFDEQNTAQNESLVVTNPKPGQVIESPLELSGNVRGSWLFEATAPVVLTDWDGEILGESYIQAEGEWMTTEFVPFSGEITFDMPEDIGDFSDKGTIIFQKANPSGLPENDAALEFDILFR